MRGAIIVRAMDQNLVSLSTYTLVETVRTLLLLVLDARTNFGHDQVFQVQQQLAIAAKSVATQLCSNSSERLIGCTISAPPIRFLIH